MTVQKGVLANHRRNLFKNFEIQSFLQANKKKKTQQISLDLGQKPKEGIKSPKKNNFVVNPEKKKA